MKSLITEAQQKEIIELSKEHLDALIAYGADMHRQGIIKGSIVLGVGVLIGFVTTGIVYIRKELKEKDNH